MKDNITEYDFDFDYKRDCILNKYSNPYFDELPRILTDLSVDDKVFKALMSLSFSSTKFISRLQNIKSLDDMINKIKEVLIEEGISIESSIS